MSHCTRSSMSLPSTVNRHCHRPPQRSLMSLIFMTLPTAVKRRYRICTSSHTKMVTACQIYGPMFRVSVEDAFVRSSVPEETDRPRSCLRSGKPGRGRPRRGFLRLRWQSPSTSRRQGRRCAWNHLCHETSPLRRYSAVRCLDRDTTHQSMREGPVRANDDVVLLQAKPTPTAHASLALRVIGFAPGTVP